MKFNIHEIPVISADLFTPSYSSRITGITIPYKIDNGFLQILYIEGWEPAGITNDKTVCGNNGSAMLFKHIDGRCVWCHTYRDISDFLDCKEELSEEDLKFIETFDFELRRN